MCGRFARSAPIEMIGSQFKVKQAKLTIAPSYNIAPSQDILAIINRGSREFIQCRWGFIPSWAKDTAVGYKMINARAETIAAKPAFNSAFRKQRCLIVADGFYEWKKAEKRKVPFYIHLKSGKLFGFAGIYNTWVSESGEGICTCAIITTEANDLIRDVHNRMPVIIPEEKVNLWLESDRDDEQTLLTMLNPYPAEEMEMHEISFRVNSPVYDNEDVIRPIRRAD